MKSSVPAWSHQLSGQPPGYSQLKLRLLGARKVAASPIADAAPAPFDNQVIKATSGAPALRGERSQAADPSRCPRAEPIFCQGKRSVHGPCPVSEGRTPSKWPWQRSRALHRSRRAYILRTRIFSRA